MATQLDARTHQDFDVEVADTILAYFSQHSRRNWLQAIRDAFPDDAGIYDSTVQRVQESLDLLELDRPHGVYVGPAVVPQDLVEDGEVAAAAIRGLKSNLRLHQVGRGRGRLLIILSSSPLSEDSGDGGAARSGSASDGGSPAGDALPSAQVDRSGPSAEPTADGQLDINAALLGVRNRFLEIESENRTLKALVEDLQIQVSTLNQRNEELYSKLVNPLGATTSEEGW